MLDRVGSGRAHVAGNSLGGWIALELARRGWLWSPGRCGGMSDDLEAVSRLILEVTGVVRRQRSGAAGTA